MGAKWTETEESTLTSLYSTELDKTVIMAALPGRSWKVIMDRAHVLGVKRATKMPTDPEELRQYRHAYYEQNKERISKQSKEWHKKHRQRSKYLMAQWRENNRDRICVYRRERYQQFKLEHPEEYKERMKRSKMLRRAREFNALDTLTPDDIKRILSMGCYFCGTHEDLTIAHNVPLARGGNTTKGYTFCLCRSCNSRMWIRTLAEVLVQKELFEEAA